MEIYTKTYHYSDVSNILQDYIRHPKFGNFIIGNTPDGGFICRLDKNDQPTQSYECRLPNQKLHFNKALFLENGELCILAFTFNSARRLILHILKFNNEGVYLSAQKVNIPNVRSIRSFYMLPDGSLAIIGWYNTGGTLDKIFVCKVDALFQPILCQTIELGRDDQLGCSILYNETIVLFGAQHSPSLRGFCIQLDLELNHLSTNYITGHQIKEINDTFIDTNGTLYLIGTDRSTHPILIKGRLSRESFNIDQSVKINWTNTSGRAIEKIENEFIIVSSDSKNNYAVSTLNREFQMIKNQTIDFPQTIIPRIHRTASIFYFYGNYKKGNFYTPIVIKSNKAFDNCKAKIQELKASVFVDCVLSNAEPTFTKITFESGGVELIQRKIVFEAVDNCKEPVPVFNLLEPYKIQSDAINLQAAGSIGKDSAKGIHLRWFLNGYLGDRHIPKGNYATNNNSFNRKDDFVKIYRIPYQQENKAALRFNLFNQKPTNFQHANYLWVYNLGEKVIYLKFLDTNKYNQLVARSNPTTNYTAILKAYGASLLEISHQTALSFAINFNVSSATQLKVETFSVANKSIAEDELVISSRKEFKANSTTYRVVAENIRTIRLSIISGSLQELVFENYEDYLLDAITNKQLEVLNDFALSKDDTEVFKRLEDSAKFKINNHWLKYNDQAFVNTANYKDRWTKTDGLKNGINDYITLSETDPLALKIYKEETDSKDESTFEISLQNFLNIAALDFHVARMLGFATIDVIPPVTQKQTTYVYLAAYITEKSVEDDTLAKFCQHLYLSLPTNIQTERLPQAIELAPITYGLEIDNATDTPLLITDKAGYAPYINTRYAQLKTNLVNDFSITSSFFNPTIEFESSSFSAPVFFGIAHKKDSENEWRKPEIAHDIIYRDTLSVLETKTILFDEESEKANFIHAITDEGIGKYAVYPINIFSRTAGLSPIQQTNFTKFIKANTLKPPVNIRGQLIQNENPLLLTTESEQKLLASINLNKKEILCRLDFDYTYHQDKNYAFGNKVGVFFRSEAPRNVIGSIVAIQDDPTNSTISLLSTDSYYYISTGETITPIISPNTLAHFEDSILTYQSKNYRVLSIIPTSPDGRNPKIRIKKIEKREAQNTIGTQYQLQQVFEPINLNTDDAFLIIENLSKVKNWKKSTTTTINKFAFEVDLANNAWVQKTESYKDNEDNMTTETIKGIWDDATISVIPPPSPSNLPYQYYQIECNTFKLAKHPQFTLNSTKEAFLATTDNFSVNWHLGQTRIHIQGDGQNEVKRKELSVVALKNIGTNQKLIITAIDKQFNASDPDKNIKVGNNISINFHPGYRVYFKKDDTIQFNKTMLLPAENEGTKYSLLGLQTIDTNTLDDQSTPYSSLVSIPITLFARELITPEQPDKPIGPFYATPPNFYNKATYSFTTSFKHKPWGLTYYRIDSNKVLSTLYQASTIKAIKENLPKVSLDDYLEERWLDLLSFSYTTNNGDFETFDINTNGIQYKLPWPDRTAFLDSSSNPQKPEMVKDLIKNAIYSNMLPLTEQPLIFQYIKNGTYVPQPKKQKIKDATGKILHPSDPEFDQAPMAKRINNTEVFFTDFTIDSNMDPNTIYFYMVREMSNSMQLGEPSDFLGPIQLVNTKAPEKIILKKIVAPLASEINNYKTVVQFYINQLSNYQNFHSVEILRTTESSNALSVRTMEVVKEVTVNDLINQNEVLLLQDDFEQELSNNLDIPFGIPLYYRLRGMRLVTYTDANQNSKTIKVYSEPTKVFLTNVIDMLPPDSPTLTKIAETLDPSDSNVIRYLKLVCNKVCFNGTYTLLYLNEYNNWEKLAGIQTNKETDLVFEIKKSFLKKNENGKKIYHKFKISIENTSGLLNKQEKIFLI